MGSRWRRATRPPRTRSDRGSAAPITTGSTRTGSSTWTSRSRSRRTCRKPARRRMASRPVRLQALGFWLLNVGVPMTSIARKLLVAFSLLGLGASSAATYVHYNLIQNPDYASFCDINATVSCKAAYLSRYGSVGGVPVAVGGLFFFAWVLLMVWGSRGKSRIHDSAPAYVFAVSTLALAVVLYLAYASFFVLKEVCPLCVATYVAVIGIFIISGGASSVPMSSLPKRALTDMRVLVATPLALVIALLFVAGSAWGITVFPRESEQAAEVPQAPPLTAEQLTEFERWW